MRYLDSLNQPMAQFEVFHGMGRIVLTVVDMTRYDTFFGFRRVVASWPQPL